MESETCDESVGCTQGELCREKRYPNPGLNAGHPPVEVSEVIRALLIEDNPGDARLIREMLIDVAGAQFDLEAVDCLSTGLVRLAAGGIDVILLDLALPDSLGLDTFVRVYAQAPETPILVLTSLDDVVLAVRAVREGAQDYLIKGHVDGGQLARCLRYAIERKQAEHTLKKHSDRLEEMVQQRTGELERRMNELSALNAMAAIVNEPLEVDEILNRAMDEAMRFVGVEAATMLLLDEEAGELVLVAHRGLSDESVRSASRVKVGEGPVGQVVQMAEPVVIHSGADYPAMTKALAEKEGFKSSAVVPLIGRVGLIGVMGLSAHSPNHFDAASVGLLRALGQHIATGVEKAQLYEALRESEERLGSFMNSATDAFYLFDQGLTLVEANKVALKMLRSTREDALGKNILELSPALKETGRYDEYREVLETGKPLVRDDVASLPDFGKMYLNVRAFKVGDGLGVIVTDITQHKQAEAALQEAQVQLIRREKLAVLGQLAGGVAHDLRNPLGAIRNAAYFLNMVGQAGFGTEEPDPEVKEALEIVAKEVERCDGIISSLLDFARAKPPTQRRTAINEVVRDALSRAAVPDNVDVVTQLDEALPLIMADPDQLAQVFGNLILNAVQAMPDGGRLVVRSWPDQGE